MKFPDVWEFYVKGQWISRRAWKKDYAISLCNLDEEKRIFGKIPILMRDTYGYLFHFGGLQSGKILRRTPGGCGWLSGLQYDLLADDWYLADQTMSDMTLKEHEK